MPLERWRRWEVRVEMEETVEPVEMEEAPQELLVEPEVRQALEVMEGLLRVEESWALILE